jgi:hypothetical protein
MVAIKTLAARGAASGQVFEHIVRRKWRIAAAFERRELASDHKTVLLVRGGDLVTIVTILFPALARA